MDTIPNLWLRLKLYSIGLDGTKFFEPTHHGLKLFIGNRSMQDAGWASDRDLIDAILALPEERRMKVLTAALGASDEAG
jgi:hypothetical protein